MSLAIPYRFLAVTSRIGITAFLFLTESSWRICATCHVFWFVWGWERLRIYFYVITYRNLTWKRLFFSSGSNRFNHMMHPFTLLFKQTALAEPVWERNMLGKTTEPFVVTKVYSTGSLPAELLPYFYRNNSVAKKENGSSRIFFIFILFFFFGRYLLPGLDRRPSWLQRQASKQAAQENQELKFIIP